MPQLNRGGCEVFGKTSLKAEGSEAELFHQCRWLSTELCDAFEVPILNNRFPRIIGWWLTCGSTVLT